MTQSQNNLVRNLVSLRKRHSLSQERVAEQIGVTRQSIAKWESGESVPGILHCDALAELYQVSLDNLVRFDQKKEGASVPPKGKHLFGTAVLGERGQIVIPQKARETLGLQRGDSLIVLGDVNPQAPGIALMLSDVFLRLAGDGAQAAFSPEEET